MVWVGRNDLFRKDAIEGSISRKIRIKTRMIKTNPYPLEHSMRKFFYFGERTEEEAKDIDMVFTNILFSKFLKFKIYFISKIIF